jgi:ATP phosphoribosyltransferase/ATP phosphoribosyltransferase regulatory subunit
MRVATKFTNITKKYYQSKGRDIDIVHLNGSVEIAPILGLTDVILDIVETGNTLRENDLEIVETVIPDISARLIANKSSFKFKSESIEKLSESLGRQAEERP